MVQAALWCYVPEVEPEPLPVLYSLCFFTLKTESLIYCYYVYVDMILKLDKKVNFHLFKVYCVSHTAKCREIFLYEQSLYI